jgi:flagellar motor switch protein FliM
MVVSFEVLIGSQKYMMTLCFPTFALEDVLAKLNLQHYSSVSSKGDGEWSSSLTRSLGTTPIPAVAVLGETSLTLRELLSLEPGDVIRTNIPVQEEVKLYIGGKSRLCGRPGISKGRMAIKVTKTGTEPLRGE